MRMTGKNHSLKTARIKDVAELDPETLGESTAPDFTFKYIDLSSVKGGRIGDELESMTFAAAPGRARKLIKEGDVLLGMVRPYLKPFAKVQTALDGHVASTGFAVIRAKSGVTDPEYLYQTIWSDSISKQIHQMVTGSNYPALSVGDVKDLTIILPPLAEQRRIAEILRTWDEAIETAEAELKAKQERMRWLMENLMKPSAGGEGVVNASKDKVISAGLKEVADFFADGDWIESKDQSPSGFRLVQTGNIGVGRYLEHPGRARYVSVDTFKRLNCTQLKAGDMLISRLPDPVGRACLFPGGFDAITAVDCTIVRVNNRVVLPAWVQYFAQTQQYQKQVDAMIGGSTRLRITRKELGAIQVPLPSLAEQRKVTEILESADAAIELSDERIEALRTQKRGLMQKLLTGEVRVAA